ncbi:MAG: hypothetical protein WBD07_16085 [Vicinamibacterales bacterium]
MASRLQLGPGQPLPFIWNVSQQVGDNVSCQNQPTDVDLVKIIIIEIIRGNHVSWVNRAVRDPFVIDGRMDIVLAYWIRALNDEMRAVLPARQAGIVSPARGASYGQYWTIVKLNGLLKEVAPAVWQDLPSHPSASPQLRSELQ